MTTYKVLWSNEHAAGVFPDTFSNKRKAETWARNWKREMVMSEPTRAAMRAARAEYQWEVIEAEAAPDTEAYVEDEQSVDYFNRYIAGDR